MIIDLEKSGVSLVRKCKNFSEFRVSSGSTKITRIPNNLTSELSYIVAFIISDGHIRKDKYRISIELANKELIEKVINKLNKTFFINCKYKTRKSNDDNRKTRYYIQIHSKPLCKFLIDGFEIKRGKKSDVVRVPKIILNSNKAVKSSFLEGVFDAEGCRRKRDFRITTASKLFRDDICDLLKDFSINVFKDQWINKKYNRSYYGLYFKAGVPKWSKGLEFLSILRSGLP